MIFGGYWALHKILNTLRSDHKVSCIFCLKLYCEDQRLCLFIRRASYLTSLSLSVLTCKTGIIVLISQSCWGLNALIYVKHSQFAWHIVNSVSASCYYYIIVIVVVINAFVLESDKKAIGYFLRVFFFFLTFPSFLSNFQALRVEVCRLSEIRKRRKVHDFCHW